MSCNNQFQAHLCNVIGEHGLPFAKYPHSLIRIPEIEGDRNRCSNTPRGWTGGTRPGLFSQVYYKRVNPKTLENHLHSFPLSDFYSKMPFTHPDGRSIPEYLSRATSTIAPSTNSCHKSTIASTTAANLSKEEEQPLRQEHNISLQRIFEEATQEPR